KRAFPKESAQILASLLDSELDVNVLRAAFVALGHLHEPEVVSAASQYAEHFDADVRWSVAFALTGQSAPLAIELLIRLSRDLDPEVRDWATFGLGTQIETDTPPIRDALAARLDDTDDDTRGEALIGLARRRDARVVSAIQTELTTCASDKALEAAEIL